MRRQYGITGLLWNGKESSVRSDFDGWDGVSMESIGGGFNVTLEVMQDPEKRVMIADTLRRFAGCIGEVVRSVAEFNCKQ